MTPEEIVAGINEAYATHADWRPANCKWFQSGFDNAPYRCEYTRKEHIEAFHRGRQDGLAARNRHIIKRS